MGFENEIRADKLKTHIYYLCPLLKNNLKSFIQIKTNESFLYTKKHWTEMVLLFNAEHNKVNLLFNVWKHRK